MPDPPQNTFSEFHYVDLVLPKKSRIIALGKFLNELVKNCHLHKFTKKIYKNSRIIYTHIINLMFKIINLILFSRRQYLSLKTTSVLT